MANKNSDFYCPDVTEATFCIDEIILRMLNDCCTNNAPGSWNFNASRVVGDSIERTLIEALGEENFKKKWQLVYDEFEHAFEEKKQTVNIPPPKPRC